MINLIKRLNLVADSNPKIQIDKNLEKLAIHKYNIDKNNFNILLGIGGSGPTKRIPANTFLSAGDNRDCPFRRSIMPSSRLGLGLFLFS